MSHQVSIDLVTKLPNGDFALTLVEQGPWDERATNGELERLQNRLFDCLEVVCSGALFQRYPEAKMAGSVVIRLHCYDTPSERCQRLFEAFEAHVRSSASSGDAPTKMDIVFEFQVKSLTSTS